MLTAQRRAPKAKMRPLVRQGCIRIHAVKCAMVDQSQTLVRSISSSDDPERNRPASHPTTSPFTEDRNGVHAPFTTTGDQTSEPIARGCARYLLSSPTIRQDIRGRWPEIPGMIQAPSHSWSGGCCHRGSKAPGKSLIGARTTGRTHALSPTVTWMPNPGASPTQPASYRQINPVT